MIVPTATNVKMKFPEFQGVQDATVELYIEEAERWVDDSWLPNDQTLALLYLTGHFLMVSIMRSQSATGQVVTQERMGPMSETYSDLPAPDREDTSDLSTTWYGLRFREMANTNFAPIAVI